MTFQSNFSSRLKAVQKLLGWSRTQLAGHLDITENYVYLLEAGKKKPSQKLLDRVYLLERQADARGNDLSMTHGTAGMLRETPATYMAGPAGDKTEQIRDEIRDLRQQVSGLRKLVDQLMLGALEGKIPKKE